MLGKVLVKHLDRVIDHTLLIYLGLGELNPVLSTAQLLQRLLDPLGIAFAPPGDGSCHHKGNDKGNRHRPKNRE